MLVKNLNGDNSITCDCKSWIDHWESHARKKAYRCSVIGCYETTIVGAHVKKVNGTNHQFIVPLCSKHNNTHNTANMDVGSTTLVPVTACDE